MPESDEKPSAGFRELLSDGKQRGGFAKLGMVDIINYGWAGVKQDC